MNEVTTSSVEIVRKENIATIINNAPASYEANRRSYENCVRAGRQLLEAITAGGMTDELDQRAAVFIEKTRKTVKKMNETRSAVTKLFDTFRSEFTALENGIDPAKAGTPAYLIQQQRNQYAAKKRAEEALEEANAARKRLEEEIAAGLAAGESKSALAKRLAKSFSLPRAEVYDAVVAAAR